MGKITSSIFFVFIAYFFKLFSRIIVYFIIYAHLLLKICKVFNKSQNGKQLFVFNLLFLTILFFFCLCCCTNLSQQNILINSNFYIFRCLRSELKCSTDINIPIVVLKKTFLRLMHSSRTVK